MKRNDPVYTNKHGIVFAFYATRDGFAYYRPNENEKELSAWPDKDLTRMLRWLDKIEY